MQPTFTSSRILLPVRPWFIVFSLVLALLANLLPTAHWPGIPDWVALVICFWGIREPRRVGMGRAFLLGLAMDVADGAVLGQHCFAYVLLAYTAATLSRTADTDGKALNEGGVAMGYDPEYQPGPPDAALLARVAAATGASTLRDLDDVIAQLVQEDAKVRPASTPIWPWFAGLAILVFLAEIALRRLTRMFVSDTAELVRALGRAAQA